MSEKKKKKADNLIFKSIRKPVAPPTRKIGDNNPDEKNYPAQRKSKHKKDLTSED